MTSGHQEPPSSLDIEALQDDVLRQLEELNQRVERTLVELNLQRGPSESASQA